MKASAKFVIVCVLLLVALIVGFSIITIFAPLALTSVRSEQSAPSTREIITALPPSTATPHFPSTPTATSSVTATPPSTATRIPTSTPTILPTVTARPTLAIVPTSTPGVEGDVAPVEKLPSSAHVSIDDFFFEPSNLTINANDSVTWPNAGAFPHTTTGDGNKWDSGELTSGQAFSVIFRQPGSYGYYCTLHPHMRGVISVLQPPAPTATSVPETVVVPREPIKRATFEEASLTDPNTGADRVVGSVELEQAAPLAGNYAARVANRGSAYLQDEFAPTDDLFLAFSLRLATYVASDVPLAILSHMDIPGGEIVLQPSGRLRLQYGATPVGAESSPLQVGMVYQIVLHQKQGSGGNAVLEAFLVEERSALGPAFAGTTAGMWTSPVDQLRIGATSSVLVDAIFDNITLEHGTQP